MKFNGFSRRLFVAMAAFTLATAAYAGPINIFNTGVDAGGTPLPDGTIGDAHYSLIVVPGGTTTIRVLTSAGGFPIGPWIGDNSTSAWIGPDNDTDADGPAGDYIYRTTFDLTGLIFGTASLSGLWSTDDGGVDILINGVSTGQTSGGFTAFSGFSINSGFIAGVNTLDFVVNNGGGPTGLRVEVSGSATDISSTPEPASFVLFGAGFAGIFMLRRRLAGKQQ